MEKFIIGAISEATRANHDYITAYIIMTKRSRIYVSIVGHKRSDRYSLGSMYIQGYTHINRHIYIYIYVGVYAHTRTYIYTHTYMYAYMRIYIYS